MRGQTSAEFILAFTIFIMLVTAALTINSSISSNLTDRVKYLKAKATADALASRINLLLAHGTDHSYTRLTLDRDDYNISLEGRDVRVALLGMTAFSRINSGNLIFNFNSTALIVRRSGNTIYVEDA